MPSHAGEQSIAAVFGALAARAIDAQPAAYDPAQLNELREQLLQADGAPVWVNPTDAGHSRATLDTMLREIARRGCSSARIQT